MNIAQDPAKGADTGAEKGTDTGNDEVVKLREQVENLNKGIATYRDDAKTAKEVAEKAQQTASEALAKLAEKDKSNDDAVVLSEEDNAKFEKWAKENGIVRQADLQAEKQRIAQESTKGVETTAVNEFLEKHPEYDTDEKWKEVMDEFNLYRTPTSLDGYKKLLDRVHKSLSKDTDRERIAGEVKADITKRSRLSIGGGFQGGAGGSDKEATIDNYMKRYPNLSRDQIEQRLSDLRALHPKK